jgi:hypothetical protein
MDLVHRPTHNERVLRALQSARGEFVGGLYRSCGAMVHSRIADLRRAGHKIESRCFGAGDWRYRLVGE